MSFKVKALFEYSSGHEDDLAFSVGQIITVTDEEDDDWYGGEYVDDAGVKHEGIFPRNFVEKYEPTAPPRPTRTRTKKEPDSSTASEPVATPLSPVAPAEPEYAPEPVNTRPLSPTQPISAAPPAPAPAPEAPAPKPEPPVQATAPPPPVRQPTEAPAVTSPPLPKAAPAQPKPSGPLPVTEKPISSSFKDRIAAFNKSAAPPIAPFKPAGFSSGSSNFIKKPFVAPPPSRHAYVPPPQQAPTAKVYRRDEDPEVRQQETEALENAGRAGLVPTSSQEAGGDEDQPKPMSLKERLALLQKQQMETAARHADAVAKKEKPKKPAKKRIETPAEATEGGEPLASPPALDRRESEDTERKQSVDEAHPPRVAHPGRRKSKGAEPHDGNEADMSGAGDTTEGPEDLAEKDDNDDHGKHVATVAKQEDDELNEEEEDDDEDEDDIDPEVRRREELRARMAKMSGGMGLPGMPGIPLFGAPPPMLPKKKKAASEKVEETEEPRSPTARAPPVPIPTMMALPGMSRPQEAPRSPEPKPEQPEESESEEEEQEESNLRTPHLEPAPTLPSREPGSPPSVPGGRPAPPPVPTDSRPPPPPPSASAIRSPSEGSVSDDELSERAYEESDTPKGEVAHATRAPPPLPPVAAQAPMSPTSPRASQGRRQSYMGESPASPTSPAPMPPNERRLSRMPPPIPSSAPAPPSATSRPPPPPPPSAPPRTPTADNQNVRPPTARGEDDGEEEEVTEYEGDYDTDIASSVPHKDALKAHQRESSFEEITSPRSPTSEAPPPPPPSMAPRAGPPPIPMQPPPLPTDIRKSVDAPRSAPPPPPPPKESTRYDDDDDDYDPYNYSSPSQGVSVMPGYSAHPPPPPPGRPAEQSSGYPSPDISSYSPAPSHNARPPPPPAPPMSSGGRSHGHGARQSLDVQRAAGRRSIDVTRPSTDFTGFVANDIDLANQSGWWLQSNSLPPQLQGRRDIFFESEESTESGHGKTIVTRDIYVLFTDYSQTVITVRFDPQDARDVHLEQRHEPPPRQLRQDQLEQSYERFGRQIGEHAAAKKDTIVGDGTPQGLVYELLRPFKDALLPVGTRAYGALVYSNLANASTSQFDEIRPGDIISVRNAKFQGKHGAMHAKYSVEVGKPDHVAIVAEWDGTKKKVRAWEQGRESKKVKLESFKLDDLRSGEVKIWRVMPRSWVGWEGIGQQQGGGQGGSGDN